MIELSETDTRITIKETFHVKEILCSFCISKRTRTMFFVKDHVILDNRDLLLAFMGSYAHWREVSKLSHHLQLYLQKITNSLSDNRAHLPMTKKEIPAKASDA